MKTNKGRKTNRYGSPALVFQWSKLTPAMRKKVLKAGIAGIDCSSREWNAKKHTTYGGKKVCYDEMIPFRFYERTVGGRSRLVAGPGGFVFGPRVTAAQRKKLMHQALRKHAILLPVDIRVFTWADHEGNISDEEVI